MEQSKLAGLMLCMTLSLVSLPTWASSLSLSERDEVSRLDGAAASVGAIAGAPTAVDQLSAVDPGDQGAAVPQNHDWGRTYGIPNDVLAVGAASSVVGLGVALAAGHTAGGLAAGTVLGLFVLHLPIHMMIWGGGEIAIWEATDWALDRSIL